MSRTYAPAAPGHAALPNGSAHLLAACLLAAALLAFHALTGFPGLEDNGGDNDSLLRLVQIRALLEGQDWFDPQQYRMGVEGGFPLHWSRLVDLPIALLILAAGALGLSASAAEAFALTAWPTLLFAAGLFLIVDTVRRAGHPDSVLPAIVLGAAALHFTGEFGPGAIDHHNVQLVLVLAMLNRLTAGRDVKAGLAAGCLAALSIAIGMETAPYVAVAGAGVAAVLLVGGKTATGLAAGFGAAFFGATTLAFLALVAPAAWTRASCDTLSAFQLSVAAMGGLGLVLAALTAGSGGPARRGGALALLGAATGLLVLALFPQCLESPFGDLDPRMRELWLDHVTEAQPFFALLAAKPFLLFGYYVTPVLGLAFLLVAIARGRAGTGHALLAAMLATAFAVSLWQVRGSTFSVPLAAIALALWLGGLRAHLAARGGRLAPLALLGGWLVSTNVVWALAGGLLAPVLSPQKAAQADCSACYARADHAELGALAPGRVLAVSNLGASILAHTAHRVLAGPYHRNQAGNLATLDAMMAEPAAARTVIRAHGIDYVVVCPGNPETAFLATRAPEGLLARLVADDVPDWLEPVLSPKHAPAVKIFAIRARN